MERNIIHSLVYTEFDDDIGPNPIFFFPSDLPENICMLVSIKTVTILSADHGYMPESLIIIPFPSLKLKGLIKYIERDDDSRRGKVAQSAITFLFREIEDVIFYKYMNYLNSLFNETTRKIIELENQKQDKSEIFKEIEFLRDSIQSLLKELRIKEIKKHPSKAFPDKDNNLEKNVDFKAKIVVVGDPGVGKTSTILRFTDNAFKRSYIPTMGTNITEKSFRVKDNIIELILWDLAGQSKWELMRKHFYQGSEAVLLIFDLTNPKSFESISQWFKDIDENLIIDHELVGCIFGNKSDLKNERKIATNEAQKLATQLNLEYFETSALTGKNVENAFYNIAEKIIEIRRP
ncbi:MAG: GTP-binding protein [Promethearchaeota archaeon]|nr:MAG: GTP-binding protein [Candidatus Lokiarchaeota archaeon]